MTVEQFRFYYDGVGDVFGYILFDRESGAAAAIDPGAPEEMEEFLNRHHLELHLVTNTHRHRDHIFRNDILIGSTGAEYRSPAELAEEGSFPLGSAAVEVFAAPGHSDDSVVFRSGEILITGDTLFTGTIGNCYTGDYETYFKSLKALTGLPGSCRIFPGHDLREYAMGVARKLDPQNPQIEIYLSKLDPKREFSLLSEELEVNPFIRWNDPALDEARRSTGMLLESEYQRFRAMMKLH